MIYTVTFNPSLDYVVAMDALAIGKTNRTTYEKRLPGGKGINVSTVLKNLGIPNVALGFIAGHTGEEIKSRAEKSGVNCDFIRLPEGDSRINIKMKQFENTEINGAGPVISSDAVEQLMTKLRGLKRGDIVVLAGSIPSCMSDSIYRDIMTELSEKGIRFVVDATKDLLLNVLQYHPFLIKPNDQELREIFRVPIRKRKDVIPYAMALQKLGAKNVLVSMGRQGAVLVDEEGHVHMLPAPKGKVVNAVGAGDSMVAGFLAGWEKEHNFYHAFKLGLAAGSASAFSEELATKEEIENVYRRI